MNVNDANGQENHSHPPNQQQQQQQQRKKCRGNRRNQRFRRKCRAQGMKQAKIEKLLQNRNQINNNNNNNDSYQTNSNTIRNMTNDNRQIKVIDKESTTEKNNSSEQMITMATEAPVANLNKRKRDISLNDLKTNSTIPKSTSSISILQPSLKKKRNKKKKKTIPLKKIINNIINKNYRFVSTDISIFIVHIIIFFLLLLF